MTAIPIKYGAPRLQPASLGHRAGAKRWDVEGAYRRARGGSPWGDGGNL